MDLEKSDNFSYNFIWESVVITSNGGYSPIRCDINSLYDYGIIPEDWVAVGASSGMETSRCAYMNGVKWAINGNALNITHEFSLPKAFGEEESPIYQVAGKFLEKFPRTPYKELGLNFLINVEFQDQGTPIKWIMEKFAPSLSTPHLFGIVPKLFFLIDPTKVFVSMELEPSECLIKRGDVTERRFVIAAEVNVHHNGPLDVDSLKGSIENWKSRQEFVLSTLNTIMEG